LVPGLVSTGLFSFLIISIQNKPSMKLLSFFSFVFIFLTLFSPHHCFSQTTVGIESDLPNNTGTGKADYSPDKRTLQRFDKSYADVENTHWSKIREGSQVTFTSNGKKWMIRYSPNGRWICTIRYLPLEQVPENIELSITGAYPGYHIFFAQDVQTPAGFAHVIKIEKGNTWKTLKVVNCEIEVMEDFEKI
jgi:hypothetical protein